MMSHIATIGSSGSLFPHFKIVLSDRKWKCIIGMARFCCSHGMSIGHQDFKLGSFNVGRLKNETQPQCTQFGDEFEMKLSTFFRSFYNNVSYDGDGKALLLQEWWGFCLFVSLICTSQVPMLLASIVSQMAPYSQDIYFLSVVSIERAIQMKTF